MSKIKQKHYIDIQNIRETDTELRERNTQAFELDDIIQITEKYDGSNACACYDVENDKLLAFSRKRELSFANTLNGFWNYIQQLPEQAIKMFKLYPSFRVFGEWSNKNRITYYDTNKIKHWYIYDIYDTTTEQWLEQKMVKTFCKRAGLEYIQELYYGPFISWEHCKSFLHCNSYGDTQEGVVIKNQTKLNNWNSHDTKTPLYLKIVNDSFKETMKHKEKIIDPMKENNKKEAQKIMESICTKNRVEKELYKMRDEGIIPEKVTPQDMGLVARNLPKRIYADLLKEEKELVEQCGEYAGKMCSTLSMKYAKQIILGD